MKITYQVKITYRDGTGATWTKVPREKATDTVRRSLAFGLIIPESISITRER